MAQQVEDRQSKFGNIPLVLLLALYLGVAFAHDTLAPLTTGPDELAHYEYIRFIAGHRRLPFNLEEREQAGYKSDQPPLYHLIAALPASLVDPTGPPFLKRVSDHPRRQLIERTRHAWGLYNTLDERWPYRGEVLRWHIGRWVAILFGAATVVVTFFIARRLLASDRLALSAAAVVAFIPRYALTGSMLNYETTLAFFAALFLWAMLRVANGQRRIANDERQAPTEIDYASRVTHHPLRPAFYPLLIGLFGGLAIVAKLSAVIFPLEVILAFWLIDRARGGLGRQVWLARLAAAGLGMVIPAGAWYGFVAARFNTIAADGLWVGLLRPLIAADPSDATTNRLLSLLTGGQAGFTAAIENLDSGPPWEWLAIFFRTFWVVGIEQHQPLGSAGLLIALALLILAGYGLFTRSPVTPSPPLPPAAFHLLLLHLAAAFVLPLVRYAVTFSLADTAQGRHVLFQTAPAFALLLVWGLRETAVRVPPPLARFYRPLPYLAPVFLLGWSLVQLWYMTWAYHPLLPVTTQPERLPPIEHRLDASLSPYVTLLSYQTRLETGSRLLRLDLWWRSDAVSPVDYLTYAALVDAQGRPASEWVGHPAGGRYPTRAWDPGDIIHDTLWLPLGGLEAGRYTLTLHLRPTAAHYPPEAQPGPLALQNFDVPESTLPIFETALSLPEMGGLAGFTAWKEGRPIDRPQPFRYRETLAVSLPPLPDGYTRQVWMPVDAAAGPRQFDPVLLTTTQALFIVGPDWPTGEYRLQVDVTDARQNSFTATSNVLAVVADRWNRQFNLPAAGQPLEANFASQVKLLGYDLAANRAEPGGGFPLTLYWQGLDWMGNDYTIFVRLIKNDDLTVHGGRDRLPREWYRTLYWAPGEVVTDPFGAPVDADAPDGIYYLNVGLYKQVGQQAISLPLVENGRAIDATSVNIGPIKIGSAPPGFTVDSASPQVSLNQPFGDGPDLTLLGYDLTDETGRRLSNPQSPIPKGHDVSNPQSPIPTLHLTLYWRSESRLSIDYTTFVHLRNAAGDIVTQKDRPPLNGAYPTSLWEPGEIIADEIVVSLPGELPAGEYQVVVGLYDIETGLRLTVPGSPANEVKLTSVEIP